MTQTSFRARERLSSLWTFFYQFVFPSVWITGFGAGTLALWFSDDSAMTRPPSDIKFTFLAAWIVGSGFILWFVMRLRTVWLEDDCLVVIYFRKQERIPLALVQDINETRFWNPKTIKVTFQPRPNLPTCVIFMAPVSFQLPFSVHPVVMRLRLLVEEARRKN